MPVDPYTHKTTPIHAIQFDGTMSGLLTIFGAVAPDPSGVQVAVTFDGDGRVSFVSLSGRGPVSFSPGDWVVIPDDPGRPLTVMADGDFQRDWQ